jgi:hypothetical protein
MDINSFLGFDRGANKEAADYARQNDGQISINPLQRFFGADESDVQNILNRENQKSLNSTYGAALALAGRGGADWGESESSIQGRIASGQRQMKASEEAKQRGYATSDRDAGFAQQSSLGRQQIEASNNQFIAQQKSQDARFAHTDKQNRLDRGLERELASNSQEMNLAIAQMNSDLADKRMDYDRETARMDKRSAAIAQLMSGLGSLGGAFSL